MQTGRAISVLALVASLSLAVGCSEDGGTSGNGQPSGNGGNGGPTFGERACEIVDAAMVTAAFEGTASEGVPQDDASCEFELTDGGVVEEVDVFFFGEEARWEGVRSGFEEFRGGTTDVPGIGDEAFYPNDTGPTSLIVRARGFIFEVVARFDLGPFDMLPPTVAEDVAELARAIAEDG